jgi:hypothetical protein
MDEEESGTAMGKVDFDRTPAPGFHSLFRPRHIHYLPRFGVFADL